MSKHTVIVWSESCTIDVCGKHKTVSVASSDYKGAASRYRSKPRGQRSSAGAKPRNTLATKRSPADQRAFDFPAGSSVSPARFLSPADERVGSHANLLHRPSCHNDL
jgi:hypothetical protein